MPVPVLGFQKQLALALLACGRTPIAVPGPVSLRTIEAARPGAAGRVRAIAQGLEAAAGAAGRTADGAKGMRGAARELDSLAAELAASLAGYHLESATSGGSLKEQTT